ncbi:tyrosine-type recombinase/integrase [Haloactinomyces albus]|uniref:Integrase n=1 Tax=Haloactinomyces albus TaxID=1352928 RepID=A0AAE3ZGP4_9ACTN|nr:tyrosine-type recombinase/integrase [Haloactinomyces albus]MDR7304532.1 integrase [Haloactinomyces albus]
MLSEASPQQRLAALDELAETYVHAQRPANTRRAYAGDWHVWEDYTRAVGIPLYAATTGSLVGFVRWLETVKQAAPATIDRRLTGAVAGLRHYRVPVTPEATRAAWEALRGYRRRLAEAGQHRGRGQATAITHTDLRAVLEACPATRAGTRDRALLLVGLAIAARRSDLANLLTSDIHTTSQGLIITVRHGKTTGQMAVPAGRHPDTCPVRAWHTWQETAGLTTDGPAFRRIDRWDHLHPAGLSPQAIGDIITRAGQRADLPYRLTGHSLRAGMATTARQAGATDIAIADQGRWQRGSYALYQYLRRVDQFGHDNAAGKLGL